MREIELRIEKIAYGGWGMGRVDGKIIFIPYTIPGEQVLAEVVREKKDHGEARLRKIKEVSPLRQAPFCSYFSRCGGCHYQHLPYKEQLIIKEEMLREFLAPLRDHANPFEINPIIASPEDRGYRIRAQFKGAKKGGKQVLGFYEMKSHQLVEVEECPLLHPLANLALRRIRECLEKESLPTIQNLEVQVSPDEGQSIIFMQVAEHQFADHNIEKIISLLRPNMPNLKGLTIRGKRTFSIGEMVLGYYLPGGPGREGIFLKANYDSFVQVNMAINQQLIKIVLEWAELAGKENVIDLFCGLGNFTLPLGKLARKVWGIDLNESAIIMARHNAEQNGLKNCIFIKGSAEEGLRKFKEESGKVDLVVLDPPRAGAGPKVLKYLVSLEPKKIIYISCEPPTLVRDLKLLRGWGYQLQKVQALDMFPQTYHFEAVVFLTR